MCTVGPYSVEGLQCCPVRIEVRVQDARSRPHQHLGRLPRGNAARRYAQRASNKYLAQAVTQLLRAKESEGYT